MGMFHLSFQDHQLLAEKSVFKQRGFAQGGQANERTGTKFS
jgi:hypothetical protein